MKIRTTWLTALTPGAPVLVVGPSLGTSVRALWSRCAEVLSGNRNVLGWDLPGHGASAPDDGPYEIDELADAVQSAVRAEVSSSVQYAGDSVGGAVGLVLALREPSFLLSLTVLCSGAKIGEAAGWHERAALVREQGTDAVLEGSLARWFAPGFVDSSPAVVEELQECLRSTDSGSYAAVCTALASFDVRAQLRSIDVPVLAIAGAHDVVTPPSSAREIATTVHNGRSVILDDVAHLAPAESPELVASLLCTDSRYDKGLRVRRDVLGDEHVDRAISATTDFTADFQRFITDYAWGGVWTRPGLDRRARSMITLTALVARGHHEELAMHVRAALRNGVTVEELSEIFLQSAIYCGVPDANTAFRIAARVLAEVQAD